MLELGLDIYTITPYNEYDDKLMIKAAYTKMCSAVRLGYYDTKENKVEERIRYLQEELDRLERLVHKNGNILLCMFSCKADDELPSTAIVQVISLDDTKATVMERYYTGIHRIEIPYSIVPSLIRQLTQMSLPKVDTLIELSEEIYSSRKMF